MITFGKTKTVFHICIFIMKFEILHSIGRKWKRFRNTVGDRVTIEKVLYFKNHDLGDLGLMMCQFHSKLSS